MKPKHKKRATAANEFTGIDNDLLEQCVRLGTIESSRNLNFTLDLSPSVLAKIRRLQRLCAGLDIDVLTGSIIVDLLEQVNEMRQELDRFHAKTRLRNE